MLTDFSVKPTLTGERVLLRPFSDATCGARGRSWPTRRSPGSPAAHPARVSPAPPDGPGTASAAADDGIDVAVRATGPPACGQVVLPVGRLARSSSAPCGPAGWRAEVVRKFGQLRGCGLAGSAEVSVHVNPRAPPCESSASRPTGHAALVRRDGDDWWSGCRSILAPDGPGIEPEAARSAAMSYGSNRAVTDRTVT